VGEQEITVDEAADVINFEGKVKLSLCFS